MADSKIYPHLAVENNKKPNRFLAFPLLGIIIKFILLIPIGIELLFLYIFGTFVLVISWFVVSFTGKYWNFAYKFFLGFMRLEAKVSLYFWGITDKYPGFSFKTNGILDLDVAKPEKPNRWFAIPLIGIFVRFILLIPYLIFSDVLCRATGITLVFSWFTVLFKGKFPESFYEFEKDTLRVATAASVYILGMSDKYPSYYISMNHQTAKLLLIIAGAIISAINMGGAFSPVEKASYKQVDYKYQSDYAPVDEAPVDEMDYNIY